MQADLFHEAEFLDKIPDMVKHFVPAKQSQGLARDIVMLIHTLLRQLQTLQNTAKFKLYQARKRKVKKKAPAPTEPSQQVSQTPGDPTDLANLFNNADDEPNKPEDGSEYKVTEFEFDFKTYEGKFADAKVVRFYCQVLQRYRTNGSKVNHAIIKLLHRVLDSSHCDMRFVFYQLSTFELFRSILNDLEVKKDKKFDEIRGFIKTGVIRKFFEDARKYPPLFAEVLFWKSADVLREIELGPSRAELAKKTKAFKWTREMEEKLRVLYSEHHDEEGAAEILRDKLADAFPECSERSEMSVKQKLNRMGLPLIAVSDWSPQELRELKELYSTFVDAGEDDPIKAIVEEETFHPSKNTYGKIRHRLKKMGIAIVTPMSEKAWSETNLADLRELYAEFEGLELGLKLTVEAIMEDPRMEGKTAGSIKHQLRDLGLIKGGATSTPWTDEDVDLLQELHAAHTAEQSDTPQLIKAIMADEKWSKGKTNMSIRKKLKEV